MRRMAHLRCDFFSDVLGLSTSMTVLLPQPTEQQIGMTGSYWSFVSDELPTIVQRFFRVSDRRRDTFVAGLSIGGYGAMRLALHQPERFAAAASLSGGLDLARLQRDSGRGQLMRAVFAGRDITGSDDDLLSVLDGADPATLPDLYVCCGTEDPLITGSRAFVDAAQRRGVTVTSSFGTGEHEWGYWDTAIQYVLDWLPLPTRGRQRQR
jgi:S-formylglutathione hydrolase FrmB